MSDKAFRNRLPRLSRVTRSTADDAIALHAPLEMLLLTEFATTKLAELEESVRQLEDDDLSLSEFVSMVSTDIEACRLRRGKLCHLQRCIFQRIYERIYKHKHEHIYNIQTYLPMNVRTNPYERVYKRIYKSIYRRIHNVSTNVSTNVRRMVGVLQ